MYPQPKISKYVRLHVIHWDVRSKAYIRILRHSDAEVSPFTIQTYAGMDGGGVTLSPGSTIVAGSTGVSSLDPWLGIGGDGPLPLTHQTCSGPGRSSSNLLCPAFSIHYVFKQRTTEQPAISVLSGSRRTRLPQNPFWAEGSDPKPNPGPALGPQ